MKHLRVFAAALRFAALTAGFAGASSLTFAPLSACAAQTSGARAFTGFTLIDGSGKPPVANAAMVVFDGRIVSVGPASSVMIPSSVERVNLAGKTVMPGIVNAHGHINAPADLRTYAAYGVTTVYSLGGEPADVFAARAAQNTPSQNQSRVFLAGPVLTPRSAEQARTMVTGDAEQKVDIVKIRVDDNLGTAQKMAPEIYRAVIDEAHKRNLRVAVHLFYLADAKDILASGGDLVAHSIRDVDVDADVIATLKAKNVCYVPTLMREVSTFAYESTPDWLSDPLFVKNANKMWMDSVRVPGYQASIRANTSAQKYKVALQQANKNLKTLSDAGVTIAMGTDTGPFGRFQGYFELMEMERMVRAGMTPAQVIAASTRDAARCMKIDRDVGALEPGKWADFVALDSSPLDDISNIRKISSVWIAGNRVPR
jgi:imidazolonepropionase-like amidohydrolase